MKFQITRRIWDSAGGETWSVFRLGDSDPVIISRVEQYGLETIVCIEINPDDYPNGNIDTYTIAALIDGMSLIRKNIRWRKDFGQL